MANRLLAQALLVLGIAVMACCPMVIAADDPKPEADKDQSKAAEKPELPVTAYIGADIHTCTDSGTIHQGVILVQGDRIISIGDSETKVPDDATVVDWTGGTVTPGLIDAGSRLWLTPPAASASSSSGSLNIVDGIDVFADDWNAVSQQGITAVYVQPANSGVLGGVGAVLSVAPMAKAEKMTTDSLGPEILKAEAAMQASLGSSTSNNRSRKQQLDRITKTFKSAADYKKKWDAYNEYEKKQAEKKAKADAAKKKASGSKTKAEPAKKTDDKKDDDGKDDDKKETGDKPTTGRPVGPRRGTATGTKSEPAAASKSADSKTDAKKKEEKAPEKPDLDPVKQRLVKVLSGELPLVFRVQTANEVHYALQLLNTHKDVSVIWQGLTNLGSGQSDLLEMGSPIMLGPWLRSAAGYSRTPDAASTWKKILADYNGTTLICTQANGPRGSAALRSHLGRAIAAGMTRQQALRAVTCDAARVLGVANDIGSLAADMRADFVCFAGHPTDASAAVHGVVSGGRQLPGTTQQRNQLTIESTAHAEQVPSSGDFALQSTRCLMPSGEIAEKIVVVRGGKVALVLDPQQAGEMDLPPLTDLGSGLITPGLFSAHATLGRSRDIDPRQVVSAGYVDAADVVGAPMNDINSLTAAGLLRVVFAPGDTNPVAGSACLLRLGASRPIAIREAALKLVLTQSARGPDHFPASLSGQLQLLRSSLAGQLPEASIMLPAAVQARLDAKHSATLQRAASAELPILLRASEDIDIRAALDLVEQMQLAAAIVGAGQLKPFVQRMQQAHIALITKPSGLNDYAWYAEDLAAASAAGIPVFFGGENAEQLRLTASRAVAAGMDRTAALTSLCYGPGQHLPPAGMTPGAPADLVVWSASPLDMSAKPLAVWIDGKLLDNDE